MLLMYVCMYLLVNTIIADVSVDTNTLLQQQLQSGMTMEEMVQHQIVHIEDSLRIGSISSIDLEFRS